MSETPSGYIAVWERIRFEKGEPVAWERSLDKGKTWEPIHWPFGELPFIFFKPTENIAEIIQVKLEESGR